MNIQLPISNGPVNSCGVACFGVLFNVILPEVVLLGGGGEQVVGRVQSPSFFKVRKQNKSPKQKYINFCLILLSVDFHGYNRAAMREGGILCSRPWIPAPRPKENTRQQNRGIQGHPQHVCPRPSIVSLQPWYKPDPPSAVVADDDYRLVVRWGTSRVVEQRLGGAGSDLCYYIQTYKCTSTLENVLQLTTSKQKKCITAMRVLTPCLLISQLTLAGKSISQLCSTI